MAQDYPPRLLGNVAAPKHYAPPTARELRAQAIHRLQIGLFGLATMLLLVGLANIIMDRARINAEEQGSLAETSAKQAPAQEAGSDPLADIGVVPAARPDADPARPKQ